MIENETMNEDITNEDVDLEIEETEEVREEPEEESDDEDTQEETAEEVIERLTKENKTLKIQKAKKAEKAQKVEKEAPVQGDMSATDMLALINAKVTDSDSISQVTEYAKFKNIDVSEALNSPVVQTILENKRNEVKVAKATNTGSARRGNSEVSEDVLLANASKGKMPESDADLDRFIEARMNRRK